MASKLKIIPLGGVTEIGKNLTVLEYGKDLIVIDCGSTFPTDEMPGIDLVIPDMTYLEKNIERIRGILITHGHEDHIGALPYALRKLGTDIPVYGSKLSLALINHKLEEQGIHNAKLMCVVPGTVVKLGCFTVEFISQCHSIAGAFALAITTPAGVVIHTGDFKVDYTPIDDMPTDIAKLAHYGHKGVLCMMSDSTNADLPGYTMSERMVGESFERYFEAAEGRIIVATFSSSIHRVQQIIDCALQHGRKICFQGRSMVNVSALARDMGYLHYGDQDLIDIDKLKNFRDDQVCVITTGSQGEPMSGLARMANNSHRLNVREGDTVIVSASMIPGNEKTVGNVINQLFQRGANVVYGSLAEVHVSGHARQEELKMFLSLVRPKYFVPVHGEYRHLRQHAMLAEKVGIAKENIFIPELGTPIELTRNTASKGAQVSSGAIMIDGSGIGDIGNIVLRDRKLLSQDGLFVVVVTLQKETGKLLAGPDVLSRGFVYVRESEELIGGARDLVKGIVLEFEKKSKSDWAQIKNSVKSQLRDYLYSQTKRNPVILPIIVEV
jgi:ribonuclease J